MVPVLADEQEEVRTAAVELLREMPNLKKVLRTYILHSRGLIHWLRERCMKSILKISTDLVKPLVELMEDPEEDVRIGAMNLAVQTRDPRIVKAVAGIFLSDSDWWVRTMAADILALFPMPDVVKLLASKLQDPDLRYGIFAALGEIDSPDALPYLLTGLQDQEKGIRSTTLTALEGKDDPKIVEAVLQIARGDPVQALRDKAEVLLESYGESAGEALGQLSLQQKLERNAKARTDPAVSELQMENASLNKVG